MPMTLITGTPGAGKTLFAVKKLVEEIAPTGRVVYHNIDGLDVEKISELVGEDVSDNFRLFTDFSVQQWMKAEDGALFVLDECQRDFPARNPSSKVPGHVRPLETHRHRGFDFWFITQHPTMLDSHVQNLCDRHFHLYRPFHLGRSTLLEWQAVNKYPTPAQTRDTAQAKNFSFPKQMFGAYKSASMHTTSVRVPWRLVSIIGAVVVAALLVGWFSFSFFSNWVARASGEDVPEVFVAEAAADALEAVPTSCNPVVARYRNSLLGRSEAGVYTIPQVYIQTHGIEHVVTFGHCQAG